VKAHSIGRAPSNKIGIPDWLPRTRKSLRTVNHSACHSGIPKIRMELAVAATASFTCARISQLTVAKSLSSATLNPMCSRRHCSLAIALICRLIPIVAHSRSTIDIVAITEICLSILKSEHASNSVPYAKEVLRPAKDKLSPVRRPIHLLPFFVFLPSLLRHCRLMSDVGESFCIDLEKALIILARGSSRSPLKING
jgi:hypothetical protein